MKGTKSLMECCNSLLFNKLRFFLKDIDTFQEYLQRNASLKTELLNSLNGINSVIADGTISETIPLQGRTTICMYFKIEWL